MILPDANLLLYAARRDLEQHEAARPWLEAATERDGLLLVDQVVVGVVRIATHPRAFSVPSTLREIVGFLEAVGSRRRARVLRTSGRHQRRFLELCAETGLTGNDIPDVYLAALALTENCRLASADRRFARFPGLDWINPLQAA